MIPIRQSEAKRENTRLVRRPRRKKGKKGESNSDWISRVTENNDLSGKILLFGGTSLDDFRLRVAQSHARTDLMPSFWSHAAIVARRNRKTAGTWELHQISLSPLRGFGSVPRSNGVQQEVLSAYDDPQKFPNIACLDFALKPGDMEAAVTVFSRQRTLVDVGSLIVEWLGFLWGVGGAPNPLVHGRGIPSAALVEGACSIAGLELTPGLSSQASCPEAIWQSAKWWHEFYESEAGGAGAPLQGYYCIDQKEAACLD